MFQIVWVVPVMVLALYLFASIKILSEYERGVIFRLGRVLTNPLGPGLALVFAPVDRMVRMSLRVEAMEVPAQDVITRDNVTVKVNAIVYFRVVDPTKAVIEVKNFLYATSQLAQTSLRSVLGEVDLDSCAEPARQDQREAAIRARSAYGAMGSQGQHGRSKAGRLTGANDSRNRPPGRGRA